MMPDTIERVFGRGRLKMATGEHVEVFREAVASGERRRYTKRFLETGDADFRQWTQREWRMLARLIGHGVRCVPDVVQFDGGAKGGLRQVQTYDAGITVDQWATLLPVSRDGVVHRHVFEDCAHWWALAYHCLAALDEIHRLQLVHLDIKADNICIPYDPASFDPLSPGAHLYPAFGRLALIDFAFSLVSRESLVTALPLGWQKDYDYQSPRLLRALEAGGAGDLRPTQELDWRCDLYSLAAMLRRYLPDDEWARSEGAAVGWTAKRYEAARSFIYRLRDAHDRDLPQVLPHAELIDIANAHLQARDLAASLMLGWTLAEQVEHARGAALVTPLTRIAAPRVAVAPTVTVPMTAVTEIPAVFRNTRIEAFAPTPRVTPAPSVARRVRPTKGVVAGIALSVLAAAIALVVPDRMDEWSTALRSRFDELRLAFSARETTPARMALKEDEAPAIAPIEDNHVAAAQETTPTVAPAQENANTTATEPSSEATQAVSEPKVEPEHVNESSAADPQAPKIAESAPPAPVQRAPTRSVAEAPQHHAHNASSDATRIANVPKPHAPVLPPTHVAAPAPTPARPSVDLTAASKATQRLVLASLPKLTPASTTKLDVPPVSLTPGNASIAPQADAAVPSATNQAPPAASATAPVPSSVAIPAAPAPAARVEARRVRPAPPPAEEPWRVALREMMASLGVTEQPAAPVEERSVNSPPVARPATRVPSQQPPHKVATPVETVPADGARTLAAPAITTPLRPAEHIVENAARPLALPNTPSATTAVDRDGDLLLHQAQRLLHVDLPRVSAQAQSDVANVLWTAAGADHPSQDRAVVNAALGTWQSERMYVASSNAALRGRTLHENAKRAFASGRDAEALDQELRAFAVHPRDPDIAGFLALLHLRVQPIQPDVARQLALYALALSGASRSTHLDDWNTFAVASALVGRDSDATRALLAELALTTNVDRSCRAALGAYRMFGERLRAPAQAVLYRVHAQGRDRDSTSCRWESMRSPARMARSDNMPF